MDDLQFEDFYAASFRRVKSAVRAYCGDSDSAQEATQEAFARAFVRWKRVRQMTYPEAWVTVTASNITRRLFRSVKSRLSEQEQYADAPNEERIDLLRTLASIPERQRQAVVLYYLLDCPVSAVADLMGLTEGAVKAHLHKARATLREALEVKHA